MERSLDSKVKQSRSYLSLISTGLLVAEWRRMSLSPPTGGVPKKTALSNFSLYIILNIKTRRHIDSFYSILYQLSPHLTNGGK